ncbi:helix-turn-helix domain-containing protein [Microbacterium paludicola]|uniref:helix-turn-helix domain-containing protein n=1 Tax=Microbacterium paludicola TaxID=300019 RepID=UPI0011A727AC|nr:helix-turn-helix domain-containing protein [Microbacterium paludicola]
MTVWAEEPRDGGSAVWGCDQCAHGGWCPDRAAAFAEARRHAHGHQEKVTTHSKQRTSKKDKHAAYALELHATGMSIRAIGKHIGVTATTIARWVKGAA